MTWRIRRIISIILSVVLLAFVSAAPFAYALEAEETPDVTESITETVEDSAEMTEDKKREEQAAESVQEEPAAESATGEADQEKTETIYTTDEPDPTATVEIPDDDWGYIEQDVLAAHISDPTEETVHSEPEATPDAPVTEAPVTEAPVTEAPDTEASDTEAPITEAPIIEISVTEQLPEETPAEATLAPAEENGTETQHTAEEISEPLEAEKATEEPNSADETVQPETTGEDEEVTVTIVATMIDENIMKLHAEVHGPQEQKYYYQWQISEDGGKTYWDILGANEEDMEIELTDSNHDDLWRVWIQAI